MGVIVSWLRSIKRRIDALHGLGPVWDDDNDDASIDEVNWKLLEDSFRRAAFNPPSVADSEEQVGRS